MLDLHSDYEDLVFRSPEIEIGRFDVQPNDELFRDAGPIVTGQVVVFPKVPVFIQPEATKRFVADPNTTVFHDLGRPYQRFRLSSEGDQCNWFSFAPSLAREVVANIEPKAAEQEPLFKFTHGSTDTALLCRPTKPGSIPGRLPVGGLSDGSGNRATYSRESAAKAAPVWCRG